MKNIHILPTNQKSKIFFNHNKGFEKYQFSKEPFVNGLTNTSNQNIYITNDEEIKEGDWCLCSEELIHNVVEIKSNIGIIRFQDGVTEVLDACKKIILTTDQDLIEDGVQAIDDEFLEWFIQNPSCESVEVNKLCYGYLSGFAHAGYKIIIPKKNFYCGDKFDYDEQCEFQCDTCVNKKGVDYGYLPKEEPKKVLTEEDIFNQKDIDAVTDYINKEQQKQALINIMKSDEELGLYDDTEINRIELVCKDCSDSLEDCACIKSTVDFPKQEIKLEEVFNDEKRENIKKFIDEINNPSQPNDKLKQAFEKYSEYLEDYENKNTYEHGFKDGAKCQQEIMYSEEEVIAFGEFIFKHTLLTHSKGVKNLLEQFKNK